MRREIGHLRITCDYVNSNQVHCNRTKMCPIFEGETPRQVIERSGWAVTSSGNVMCEEHSDSK